jgi:hypothetical protein
VRPLTRRPAAWSCRPLSQAIETGHKPPRLTPSLRPQQPVGHGCFAEKSDSCSQVMEEVRRVVQLAVRGGRASDDSLRPASSLQHAVQFSSVQLGNRSVSGGSVEARAACLEDGRIVVCNLEGSHPNWTPKWKLCVVAVGPAGPAGPFAVHWSTFYREGPKPALRDDVRNAAGGGGTRSVSPCFPTAARNYTNFFRSLCPAKSTIGCGPFCN